MKKALVMLSGGADSATALADAVKKYSTTAIFFDYGQKSADLELTAARQIARNYGVALECVDISGLKKLFLGINPQPIVALGFKVGSGGGTGNCPHGLFGIASTYCVSAGINLLVCGLHADDVHGLNSPAEYFASWGKGISTLQCVEFDFSLPFIDKAKAEVLKIGSQLGVPFDVTRSCSTELETHCGTCEACVKRRDAFASAELKDATKYSKAV